MDTGDHASPRRGDRLVVLCADPSAPAAQTWTVADLDGGTLVCAVPADVALVHGTAVMATYHVGETMVVVETDVVEALPGAARLRWPLGGEQRRFARIACQLAATVTVPSPVGQGEVPCPLRLPATVVNLGAGGLRFVAGEPLVPGASILVHVTLDNHSQVSAVGRIASCEMVDGITYSMRVVFTSVSAEHAAVLSSYVAAAAAPLPGDITAAARVAH